MNDEEQVIEPRAATAEEAKAVDAAAAKPGPAHELRQAQALLAGGLFPGQMAPAVVSAFQTLGKIADKIEADAKAAEPTFTERVKTQIAEAGKESK
jgi:hypothetical protein